MMCAILRFIISTDVYVRGANKNRNIIVRYKNPFTHYSNLEDEETLFDQNKWIFLSEVRSRLYSNKPVIDLSVN